MIRSLAWRKRGFFSRAYEASWNWILVRFKLLPVRNENLRSMYVSNSFWGIFKPVFRFATLLLLIVFAFYVFAELKGKRSVELSGSNPLSDTEISQSLTDHLIERNKKSPYMDIGKSVVTDNSGVMVRVNDKVFVAVASKSSFTKLADDRIKLDAGKLWLNVEKGGEGFSIVTKESTVHVTGTKFGVQVFNYGSVVEVQEGSVDVKWKGTTLAVKANTRLRLGDQVASHFVHQGRKVVSQPKWVDRILMSRKGN